MSLPKVWLRAHPFTAGTNRSQRDLHNQFFDTHTDFHIDLLPKVPISYFHNWDVKTGRPIGKPIAIGITSERKVESDGRWDLANFFDDLPDDVRTEIEQAIQEGTLRASPTVVPDFHKVNSQTGHIDDWLTGSIAVLRMKDNVRPASLDAIALPVATMKALYQDAGIDLQDEELFMSETNQSTLQVRALQHLRSAWDLLNGKPTDTQKATLWEETFSDTDKANANTHASDSNKEGDKDMADETQTKPATAVAQVNNEQTQLSNAPQVTPAQLEALMQENATMKANFVALQNELNQTKFNALFDVWLNNGKVLPAERTEIMGNLLQLAQNEYATQPTMKASGGASDGAQISFLQMYQNAIDKREPRVNVDDKMKGAGYVNEQQNTSNEDKPLDPQERRRMMQTTAMGRKMLAEEDARAHKSA